MEINDLQIFLKVVQCGSISKAAEELGYVQPNVSERIKKLEEELGVPLFNRTNRGVEILPPGEIVQNYAVKLMSLINEMKSEVQSSIELYNIGTTPTIAKIYLEKKFAENDIICSLYIESNPTLKKLLENNDLDLVITNHSYNVHTFEKIHSFQESLVLFKSINKENINLQTETFFVSSDKNCPFRQHTLHFINEKNLSNSQLIEIDSLNIILTMVFAQKGIAFLPKSSLDNRFEILQDTAPKSIDINFYVRKDSSKPIPKFLIS